MDSQTYPSAGVLHRPSMLSRRGAASVGPAEYRPMRGGSARAASPALPSFSIGGSSGRPAPPTRQSSFRQASPARSQSAIPGGSTRTASSYERVGGEASRVASPMGGVQLSRAPSISWSSPRQPRAIPLFVYPCSGGGAPERLYQPSSVLTIGQRLDELQEPFQTALCKLAFCIEELAKHLPTHSDASLLQPRFGQLTIAFVLSLLTYFDQLVVGIAQWRRIAEGIWRMSGGLLGLASEGGVVVEVERPDPEGGSNTVTMRERLDIVGHDRVAELRRKVELNGQLWAKCEAANFEWTMEICDREREWAESLIAIERVQEQQRVRLPPPAPPRRRNELHLGTISQTAKSLQTYLKQFRLISTHLCSDPTIDSGIWYNALESQAVFQLYRRIDDSCRKSHTQILNAFAYMLQCLNASGFLPNAPPELDFPPHMRLDDGFPSIELERARQEEAFAEFERNSLSRRMAGTSIGGGMMGAGSMASGGRFRR